ncbi:hypothetical protein [Reyranella sp.]|jgi:hypothetical protein|uniref:hypothetical protein n=1 Tax=Reyranella sp. TaxID=1929291 RepID=UPI002F93F14E
MGGSVTLSLTPEVLATKTIDQLVSFFGDGKLRDNSECSDQLRTFLKDQSSTKLDEFATYCLENKFDKSGQVLQDVINEIGRRLGYQVESGRYSGTTKDIGFDGLWSDGQNWLVIEVKTTDTYRISLETPAGYSRKLQAERNLPPARLFTLIVVGRQDTGDLEAQVRGSRYAWNVRLVSVDALVKLMYVKEELDDDQLHAKIKQVLLPIEYTRVDEIIDLVFETQQETDQKAQSLQEIDEVPGAKSKPADGRKFIPQFTAKEELEGKRSAIIKRFFTDRGSNVEAVTRSAFEDAATGLRAVCMISKRYKSRPSLPYWYALHPHSLEFLRGGKNGYVILGCVDQDVAYALPLAFVETHLDGLNKTELEDRHYWHIKLQNSGDQVALNLPKAGQNIDLTPYAFAISG